MLRKIVHRARRTGWRRMIKDGRRRRARGREKSQRYNVAVGLYSVKKTR